MITLPAGARVLLASRPVDFRKGAHALAALAAVDERLVRVVEMRFFVGLEMAEIAAALGVAKRTVERDWEKARSSLYSAMKSG